MRPRDGEDAVDDAPSETQNAPVLSVDDAFLHLDALGAPPRLITHARLVLEAGELLLAPLARLRVPLDAAFVRAGVVLHDAGKALHPTELDGAGARHEDDGERALLARGVCRAHAQWHRSTTSREELLVALADALWKGARRLS